MLIEPVPDELVKEFERKMDALIHNQPIKIWLAKKRGHRVDALTAIGTAQPQPIKLFDHGAGFYLLGEGVTPELLSPIHAIFEYFCTSYKDACVKNNLHKMNMNYRSVREADPYWYNRLILHYPFAAPSGKHEKEI